MIMLYAVRIKLVFISSVAAMKPLRMISVTTGRPRSFAFCRSCHVHFDIEIAESINDKPVARGNDRRRCIFLHQGGAVNSRTGGETVTIINRRIQPATKHAELDV